VATTPKGRLPPASLWNPSELLHQTLPYIQTNILDVTAKIALRSLPSMAPRYTVHPEHNPCAALPLPSSMMAIREYWFEFRRLMMQIYALL